jgi:hypothetical protein
MKPNTSETGFFAMENTITNLASTGVWTAWKEAGEPSGESYVRWAREYYQHNTRDNDGDWNAHLFAALGGMNQAEQYVCRIF